jgi:hypothetical protein
MRWVIAAAGLTAWMTLSDRFFHVDTGTLVQFWRPFLGEQTFWVIPTFALGAISLVAVAPRFATPRARPLRFLAEVLIMTAVYATSGYVGLDNPLTVTAAFSALFALRLAASTDRGNLVVVAVLLGVGGPLFESLMWALGMFAYAQPDIIGVPWWLVPFYANGAWAVRELGALLNRPDQEAAESPNFSARSAY